MGAIISRFSHRGVSPAIRSTSDGIQPEITNAWSARKASSACRAATADGNITRRGGFWSSRLPATSSNSLSTGPGHSCVTTTPVPRSSERRDSVNAVT